MQELASLHFGAFGAEGHGRASRELDAVVDSTERATQQILEAAESIDEAANTLSASLKQEQEQALTSDIRDHVVRYSRPATSRISPASASPRCWRP